MFRILDSLNFAITECDISEMIPEINRFVLHIFLVQVISSFINKEPLIIINMLKTLLITTLAIIGYHIIFKKISNKKLKNIKFMCKKK